MYILELRSVEFACSTLVSTWIQFRFLSVSGRYFLITIALIGLSLIYNCTITNYFFNDFKSIYKTVLKRKLSQYETCENLLFVENEIVICNQRWQIAV